jgi:hypothetical protein
VARRGGRGDGLEKPGIGDGEEGNCMWVIGTGCDVAAECTMTADVDGAMEMSP